MKKFWFIIVLCGLCVACSDFLEPKSQSEYVPKNAAALNEMLIGSAYPKGAGGRDILKILPILDDDICCTDTSGGVVGNTNERNFVALKTLFSWQPEFWKTVRQESNILNEDPWEYFYQYILGTNAALDYVDDVNGTFNEKTLVEAQAYALRAFYYFHLVNMFGEPYTYNRKALGVPLKITSAMEDKDLPRNTVEEVYEQILNDLNNAEKLYEALPDELQFKRDYRTSLPMVQLLKSRVYLYMEDWKNVITYAQKVIANPNFSLLDLNTIPAKTEKTPYYNFISMETSTECIWTYGAIDTRLLSFELDVLEDPTRPLGDVRYSYKIFNAAPDLLNSYEEGDLRKENYIIKGISKEKVSENLYENRPDGYFAYGKFSVNSDLGANSGTDFAYAFRLAEAYLNLAEATAMDGQDGVALEALNTLRLNRFTSDKYVKLQGISGEKLIEKVRLERRLDYVMKDIVGMIYGVMECLHFLEFGKLGGRQFKLIL